MFKPISDWDKSIESTRIFLENLAVSAQLMKAMMVVTSTKIPADDKLHAWEAIWNYCQEVEIQA